MNLTIIGIDCATDPKKTGLALSSVQGNRTTLREVTTGRKNSPATIIHDWIQKSRQVLMALDAPLGWPADLSRTLAAHIAGERIEVDPNDLFRRETDRLVARTIGKQPLDVGADRIARTAHSALRLLSELRELTGAEIPLAWSPKLSEKIEAIEVYPAAKLSALELPSSGYKTPGDKKVRKKILDGISEHLDLSQVSEGSLVGNADLLDAAVCVLAAKDFLDWKVLPPVDSDLARQEGWIWVRPPSKKGQ